LASKQSAYSSVVFCCFDLGANGTVEEAKNNRWLVKNCHLLGQERRLPPIFRLAFPKAKPEIWHPHFKLLCIGETKTNHLTIRRNRRGGSIDFRPNRRSESAQRQQKAGD
jgi:hypothetical protein